MRLLLRLTSLMILASLSLTWAACNKSSKAGRDDESESAQPVAPEIPDDGSPRPHPNLTPDQVVRLQIEALRQAAQDDSGIQMARRFVSPRWRSGEREGKPSFTETFRASEFHLFQDYTNAELGEVKLDGNRAYQIVLLENSSGQFSSFLFVLGKQTDDPFQDCWLTRDVQRNLIEFKAASAIDRLPARV